MEQARVIKDAKVIEVVQVVYLAGEENSFTNPLRLITEYRSKDGAFLAEFDSHQYQKGSEKYGHQRRI